VNMLSRAEKVAFSWLAEATQLYKLVTGDLSTRVLLLDFDQVLADKETNLTMILRQLDVPFDQEGISRLLASPVFNSYSKQPGFRYTQAYREASIKQSRVNNAVSINQGVRFVESLVSRHPVLQETVNKVPVA
jgi:hypothetical protein